MSNHKWVYATDRLPDVTDSDYTETGEIEESKMKIKHNADWSHGYDVGFKSAGQPLGQNPHTDWQYGFIAGWKQYNREQSQKTNRRMK